MYCSDILLAISLCFCLFATKVAWCDGICDPSTNIGRELSGTIESQRNETGGWVTTFWAEREAKGKPSDSDKLLMSVNHRYFECQGKTNIKIHGVITETTTTLETTKTLETTTPVETDTEPTVDYLRFHGRYGTNARVTNNGKSLEKINKNKWDDGVAFTNRPLRDDELFEVVIDVRGDQSAEAIGIGVTTHSPDTIQIIPHMNRMKNGTWMMYNTSVYKDYSAIKRNYMKDLREIMVGETIGIKRTSTGDLHLFINGVDQGVAASNVPSPVYGVFELYLHIYKVTIVDH